MSTSPATQAKHCPKYRKRKNRIAAQVSRDKAREKFNKDLQTYELFNSICKWFGPQKWVPSEFNGGDIPVVGDRKEKNRISSRNSRVRKKAMQVELQTRLSVLQESLKPSFEAPMDFSFPFNEANVVKFQSGTWVLGKLGWVRI